VTVSYQLLEQIYQSIKVSPTKDQRPVNHARTAYENVQSADMAKIGLEILLFPDRDRH
jgi:hypothetical protein